MTFATTIPFQFRSGKCDTKVYEKEMITFGLCGGAALVGADYADLQLTWTRALNERSTNNVEQLQKAINKQMTKRLLRSMFIYI